MFLVSGRSFPSSKRERVMGVGSHGGSLSVLSSDRGSRWEIVVRDGLPGGLAPPPDRNLLGEESRSQGGSGLDEKVGNRGEKETHREQRLVRVGPSWGQYQEGRRVCGWSGSTRQEGP